MADGCASSNAEGFQGDMHNAMQRQIFGLEDRMEELEKRMCQVERSLAQVDTTLQRAMSDFLPKVDALLKQIGNSTREATGPSPSEELLEEEKRARIDEMRRLLEKGADVNARRSNGETLLHSAASRGHAGGVALLLQKGADVHAKCDRGRTALFSAAEGDASGRCVALLIAKGADVNAKDRNGCTPLHRAAFKGHSDVVSLLLQKGADINATGSYGESPMHFAARGDESGRCVALLIAKGAEVNAGANNGSTPLHCAAINGNEAAVRALLAGGARKDATNDEGERPFEVAYTPQLKELLRF